MWQKEKKNVLLKDVKGDLIYKVKINDKWFATCYICGEFFAVTGKNHRYCPNCKDKVHSIK